MDNKFNIVNSDICFSFIALKSKEKLSIFSAITLIISGITIAMIFLELLIL